MNKKSFFLAFILFNSTISAEERHYVVAGTSMLPTLSAGDQVIVDTDAYTQGEPRIDDLVAVTLSSRKRHLIKRVIAVAGDNVFLDKRGLSRNNRQIENIDLSTHGGRTQALANQLRHYNNRIPVGNVILAGDNPKNSLDSLRFGLISTRQISGKITSINGIPVDNNLVRK